MSGMWDKPPGLSRGLMGPRRLVDQHRLMGIVDDPTRRLMGTADDPVAARPDRACPLQASGHSSTLPTRLFAGLDLGQRADHSALILLDRSTHPTGEFDHVHYRPLTRLTLTIRLVKHWPLGTPYLDIADWTAELLKRAAPKSDPALPVLLALDYSGPGAPVFELLRSARTRAHIQPVLITSGQRPTQANDSTLLIPRDHLLSELRVLLERNALTVPDDLPLGNRLREELAALGQTRSCTHDDLAIALALAVCAALRATPALRRRP